MEVHLGGNQRIEDILCNIGNQSVCVSEAVLSFSACCLLTFTFHILDLILWIPGW